MACNNGDSVHNAVMDAFKALTNNGKLLAEVVEVGKDAASSLGLLLKDAELPNVFSPVPITLLPSLVPAGALQEVISIQDEINLLMHRVSHDREFLTTTLAGVASVDPFIKNLLEIYAQVRQNKKTET